MDLSVRLSAALAGRYEILREIGRGGMSVVFLARDLSLDREVALKALRPELTASVGAERFQREIQLVAHFEHIHLLQLHESGTADGVLYYAMPYARGGSLRDLLRKERQLGLDDIIRITTEIAEGIAHAHERGVVHRDLKPENILFVEGHAVVADFGIAHAYSEAGGETFTEYGIAIGTPPYMSPEQAAGERQIDHRSDIYALGCVVYEMLTGGPPFEGPTTQAVLAKQMHERVPSVAIIRSDIPGGMVDAVERALAKVPADRYQSAVDFAKALEQGRYAGPKRRWRGLFTPRAAVAGMVVAVVAAAGLLATRPWVTSHLAPNRIVVFPLATTGASVLPPDVGHMVTEIIGSTLEQTEPLKWLAGSSWLTEAEREDPRRLSPERAEGIARRQNARYHLSGAVIERGDSSDVILRLYDVEADSLVLQRSASGAATLESTVMLGSQAVTSILPSLIEPGRRPDPDVIAGRDPAAVALWAQGDREYRSARFLPALGFYQRAVEADSLLAMAALKGAIAASWKHRTEDANTLLDVALVHELRLPPKHAHFAHGLAFYQAGVPDSAVIRFHAALALDPDWPEAWTALAETHRHLLVDGSDPDSLAEAAFRRAIELDPEFTPPLFHLVEYAIWRNDVGEAERLARRFRDVVPDSALSLETDIIAACAREGPRGIAWDEVAAGDPFRVLATAVVLGTRASQPACAIAAYRAVLASPTTLGSEHWGATLGLQSLLVALKRYDEVHNVLAQNPVGPWLYLMDVAAGAPFETEAKRAAAELLTRVYQVNMPTLWLLGVWAASQDSAAIVQTVAAAARRKAEDTGTRRDVLISRVLSAYEALVTRDTVEALRRFSALEPSGSIQDIRWQPWESLGLERMTLAQLLLARGESDAANRVAKLIEHPEPLVYVILLPASLNLRAGHGSEVGNRAASLNPQAARLGLRR